MNQTGMRGAVIVLMLLTVSGAFLYAAGTQEESTKVQGVAVSGPGEFPIVDRKIELSFFAVQDPRVENLETNWYTQYLEDKTNIHIDWDLVPSAGMNEKRGLILASGDYPDVFFDVGVTKDEQMNYGPQGVFVPLNNLIEKQGVNTKKVFAEIPGTREAVTAPDGNIYSLFYINECFHCSMAMKMWVNREWLKALDIALPQTTEEFYRMLVAFRDGDPNGNGKKDEIPLSGAAQGGWYSTPYDFLMNAFIYNDAGDRFIWTKGKVSFAANTPQWREGLRFVKKLFEEKLIDPASFTQDGQQLKQLGENPEIMILGAVGAGYPGTFAQRGGASQREAMYETVPPLEGPSGYRTTAYFVQAPGTGEYLISNKCTYPEAAFKWADLRLTYEESLNLNYGKQGVNWDWAKPGQVGMDGKPAIWDWIQPLENPQNVTWYLYGPFLYDAAWRTGQAVPADADMYATDMMNLRLEVETRTKYAPYVPDEAFTPPLWVTSDVADEVAQLATTIREYVTESSARFIVGDLDLDKDWDSYVRELERMGVPRYLEIYQKLYDEQY